MVGMRRALIINIALLFLLTLQTEIVVATDGDFNAACISGTTCTSPDHVCDPVGTICRKKSGVACTSTDTPVGCVTDATCAVGSGQTCTCPSTTHIVSGGLCKLKVDATCSSSTAKCVTNAACPSGGGTCACNTGYVASSDKTACLLKSGQACTADTQCTANSVCSTGTTRTCTCSTNYVAQTSGLCTPKDNTYGGSCTIANNVDSCVTSGSDQNAVCSGASGTCGCNSGYTATVGTKCLLKSGQACTADTQCTANSACPTGATRTCTCSTNYVAQTSGLCTPKDNAYGGSCTIVNSVDSCVTSGADANAVCSAATGGSCGCKSGYTATVGAKCSGAMTFAGSVFLLVAALILTTYLQ